MGSTDLNIILLGFPFNIQVSLAVLARGSLDDLLEELVSYSLGNEEATSGYHGNINENQIQKKLASRFVKTSLPITSNGFLS